MLKQLGEIFLALVPVFVNLLRQAGQVALAGLRWVTKTWTALLPTIRAVLPAAWQSKLPDSLITGIAIGLLALLLWLPSTLSGQKAVAEVPSQSDQPAQPAAVDPNASRVAEIQAQMVQISADYRDGLITAVQANFPSSRLTIRVNDDWYSIEPSQRERLANELLKRSKKLAFQQLEIADLKGTVLARPPVVGTGMVLLKTVSG
jgi:hypothetical protein